MFMNKAERQTSILALLRQHPDSSVQQMSQAMQVSQVTIRKDLKQLEEEGLLLRSYGKATLMRSAAPSGGSCFIPPEFQDDYVKKQQIGQLAASLVRDEDFLFIGPGYTCLEVGNNLKSCKRLSILTNNISAAIELADVPEFKLMTTPGDFTRRNGTYYVTGPSTIKFVEHHSVDKMFITADGISMERGLSVLDETTAQIYHALVKPDTQVIVCATGNKFSKNALTTLGPLTLASTIVTNVRPEDKFMHFFEMQGIEVIYPDA